MAICKDNIDQQLENMKAIVEYIESGDPEQACSAFEELARQREVSMFQELGKLTRDLHSALSSFNVDPRVAELAEEDLPDAKARLTHVISMTDDAANQTLTAVEEAMPVCDALRSDTVAMRDKWQRFVSRDMEAEDFRQLCREMTDFFPRMAEGMEQVNGNLSTVLMAQGFQDLTGQIIKKVITLVEEVESGLVNIIRVSGQGVMPGKGDARKPKTEDNIGGNGPQVPGIDSGEAVSNQDEVDDLLSSLGF